MLESLILGLTQGVAEWLPVSSEGLVVLIKTNFFPAGAWSLESVVHSALFLHLGTFLAALVYFRREVGNLLRGKDRQVLQFLIIATVISGGLGFALLKLVSGFESSLELSTQALNIAIGLLLLVTAGLLLKRKGENLKTNLNLQWQDGVLLGLAQTLAVLPGLSRSGLTVAALLLRKFDDEVALKLSFLLSLPIVLAGNIVLNAEYFAFNLNNLIAFAAAFGFGLLTIHWFLALARKINFGYFTLGFGLLVIAAAFV